MENWRLHGDSNTELYNTSTVLLPVHLSDQLGVIVWVNDKFITFYGRNCTFKISASKAKNKKTSTVNYYNAWELTSQVLDLCK